MKNAANVFLSICILLISLILIMISAALFEFFSVNWSILLVVLSSITFIVALAAAILLDYGAGVYECKKCGHKFKPTLRAYVLGAHTVTRRYLKCPHCGEKNLCKRRMSE
ncbi:MAG: hypothetical protein ACI4DY_10070 [Monoglobaceae bacterium]